MTESLLGFAALAIVSDKAVAGTRLLAAAGALGGEKITTAWPATRQEYERYPVLAASKLTGPAFQSALATGRILSLDEAVLAVQEVVDNVQTSHTLAEQVAELTPRETGREYPCLHGGPSILTLLR
ncbi:MAG TPA: hypothetical protein VK879_05445 [Candidatus Sulfomarinibacteraceae bacterium]|nr:hypothetical protein [Candidatus Sulfomarinibacteraceae bacterium]